MTIQIKNHELTALPVCHDKAVPGDDDYGAHDSTDDSRLGVQDTAARAPSHLCCGIARQPTAQSVLRVRLPALMRSAAAWRAGHAAGVGPAAVAFVVAVVCSAIGLNLDTLPSFCSCVVEVSSAITHAVCRCGLPKSSPRREWRPSGIQTA